MADQTETPTSRRVPADRHGTVAARLNFLVENVYPAGRRPYTSPEIASRIEAMNAGATVTSMSINKILTGERPTPQQASLRLLARFFNVDEEYFHRSDNSMLDLDYLREMSAMREYSEYLEIFEDPSGREIMALAMSMTPATRAAVADIMRRVLSVEGQSAPAAG